jgi:hypothetical protein
VALSELLSQMFCYVGTGFFAPEMIMYGKYYGDKADIWSIGCILLELVLGHEKFCDLWMTAYDYEVRHAVAACPRHYKSHRLIFGVLLRVGNARQGIIWSRNFRLCDKTPR